MREDYLLYIIGIVCFTLTGVLAGLQQLLWAVPTGVLGLIFIGLGYCYRPQATAPQQPQAPQASQTPEPPKIPTPPTTITQEEEPEPEEEAETEKAGLYLDLTEVKGIGEKREEQLESAGIYTVKQLVDSTPEDLADRLDVSPKFTSKWIKNAKKLIEEQ